MVKQLVEGEYTNAKGRRCPEKLLLAEEERHHHPTVISLRDSWYHTSSLAAGTVVHVAHLPGHSLTESRNPPGQIVISDFEDSPLLIVYPDHMLSATTVADSFDCIRKAVLQDRIKATGETSKAMVYGKILHEIFQQALSANRWEDIFLADLVERTVLSHVEGLWELGMADTVLAVEEVRAKMGELAAWAKSFVSASPSDPSLVDDKKGEKVWLSISKLIAIEEHIWSPRYGLKGNVDATVQTTLMDHPHEPFKRLVAPFEVKTGRTSQSPSHVAQTALYTLLLSDRYDLGVKAGILYYLESSATMRVAPRVIEIRQMIQQRNRLAGYLHRARHPAREPQQQHRPTILQTQEIEESGLPGMLRNPVKCGRCYAQASCFAYHALVENGDADSAGMVDDAKKNHSLIWHEALGHLQLTTKDKHESAALREWFTKWDKLLTFEESDISRYRKELWTMSSSDREAVGRCFGNMILAQDLTSTASALSAMGVDGIEGSGGRINRYAYRFVRADKPKRGALNEATQLTVGEPVVVSSETGQWALANGYVVASSKRDITVAVDRRLGTARERRASFDEDRNQSLQGIMNVGYEDDRTATRDFGKPVLYRLDRDEFSNGLALIRNNLVTLMSSHPIHSKLRRQVVHGAAPKFSPSGAPEALRESQLTDMNEDQRAAVSRVLCAQDYALILGMPGTGKTTTIAQLIRALLAEGKSILLTSYTHTAVDNILLKIRDIAPPNSVLRLGVPAKINPEVQKFCRLAATPRGSIAEVDEAYMGCQIVAATCMGMNQPLFNRRAFDVCIVDEASQITLPTSLGPLLHARKFVLVGDHYQLPPLVQDKAALDGGLDVSLFRQLSEQYPDAVAALGRQYRMCEEIMSLSNALIYDGQLRCGNDAVAQRTLEINDPSALVSFHHASQTCATPSRHGACWLEQLCRSDRKVVFANTDSAGKSATETLTSGKNITNQYEATLTAQLVIALLAVGVAAKEIGVITLYRSQLALLRQLFKAAHISSDVEIDSADRFQGRDKECVILSMVRSNEVGVVGDLLKDWRRVNVALTRARSKLIVLGSRQTLGNNDLLNKFLRLVDDQKWTLELPADADACHNFDWSSQALSSLMTPASVSRGVQDGRGRHNGDTSVSPSKKQLGPASSVLQPSASAANRSPIKKPGKVVSARGSQKRAKMKEYAAIEILEDIVGAEG